MKTSVDRKELLKAIQLVKAAVPNKANFPVLSYVKLQCAETGLFITGTNLDNGINVKVNSETGITGTYLVNCKQLLDIIKVLKTDRIQLTLDSDKLLINNIQLSTLDVKQFPDVKLSYPDQLINIDLSTEFINTMKSLSGFCASDLTRVTLTGVNIELSPDHTIVTATDGHRLGTVTINPQAGIIAPFTFIMPRFPINQLHKHIKLPWRLTVYRDHVVLTSDNITIVSKIVYGPYPKYKQVIPGNNPNVMTFDRIELLNALESLIPCTNKITGRITFDYSPNKTILTVNNDDTGQSGTKTISRDYNGASQCIGYNAIFIKDILSRINTDTVKLSTGGPTSATVIEPAHNSTDIFLIMPLRLS